MSFVRRLIGPVALAGLGAGLGSAASAATVHVHPGESINAAIAAAPDGSTIVLHAGVYFENVLVSNRTGLTLRGQDKVMLDARPLGANPSGASLVVVNSSDIEIRKLAFRHALGNPDPASGILIKSSTDVRLADVAVSNAEAAGIEFLNSSGRALRCSVRRAATGILGVGDAITVEKCKVQQIEGTGIDVAADVVRISKCEARTCGEYGIRAEGADCVLDRNRASACGAGISARGTYAAVRRSKVSGLTDDAGHGVLLNFCSAGEARDNRVADARGAGVAVGKFATNCSIAGNTVTRCAFGFMASGGAHQLVDNVATACAGDGFALEGGDLDVADNRALGNGVDGFDIMVFAVNAELHDNLAEGNGGEGIAVQASGAKLVHNVLKKNRIDLGIGIALAQDAGNVFGTLGAPEIE